MGLRTTPKPTVPTKPFLERPLGRFLLLLALALLIILLCFGGLEVLVSILTR